MTTTNKEEILTAAMEKIIGGLSDKGPRLIAREALKAIAALPAQVDAKAVGADNLRDALALMYDRYENGVIVYEISGGEAGGPAIGQCVRLDDEEEARIIALLDAPVAVAASPSVQGESIDSDGHFSALLGDMHPLSKQAVIAFVNENYVSRVGLGESIDGGRAAFEVWAKSQYGDGPEYKRTDSGRYLYGHVQKDWELWQAARLARTAAPSGMGDFLADLDRSRAKHPRNRTMFDGLMGEINELARAYHGDGDVKAEAFDVAVCAFRIATEGDAGGNVHPLIVQAAAPNEVKPIKKWEERERADNELGFMNSSSVSHMLAEIAEYRSAAAQSIMGCTHPPGAKFCNWCGLRAAAPAENPELDRAKRALLRAGFQDLGGQEWKPPLGRPPVFIEVATADGLTPLDYRAQGREEVLAIILAEDPEAPFAKYTASAPNNDSGDFSSHWLDDDLRKLLHIGDRRHDAYDRAEAAYWDAMGRKSEAEVEMNFIKRAPFYQPLHDFLAKHNAYDLMASLKRPASWDAPAHERANPELAGLTALTTLCDQIDAMQLTMFRRPGTGQNYSYLVHEDVAAYVEQARAAAPTAPDGWEEANNRARELHVAAHVAEQEKPDLVRLAITQRKQLERVLIGLRDGWATRADADAAIAILAALPVPQASGERDAVQVDAARYRYLRNVSEQDLGKGGQPCIAMPNGMSGGYYMTEENADFAVDASIAEAVEARGAATTSKPDGEAA